MADYIVAFGGDINPQACVFHPVESAGHGRERTQAR
jgi:hypothetical protein